MNRRQSNFHWDVLLDEDEWDREEPLEALLAVTEPNEPVPPNPVRRYLQLRAALVPGVVLLCAGMLWFTAQQGAAAIDAELHDVAKVENWLRNSDGVTSTATLVDAEADPAWRSAYLHELELASADGADGMLPDTVVVSTRLRSGLAMMQVSVTDEAGEAYRETRFYRTSPHGWQRTSPDEAFWGKERLLDTRHFHIRYRQKDTQAVIAAAPRLDDEYEQLRADLGLTGDAPMLTVDVEPVTLESLGYLHFHKGVITVPSPSLLHAPSEAGDDAMLIQSIVYSLAVQVWNEADGAQVAGAWHAGASRRWEPMTRGLQLWLGAADDELAARWLSETVAWLYAQSPDILSGLRQPEPADRDTLCLDGSLWWITTPASVNTLCKDPDWDAHLRWLPRTPDTLRQLLATNEWDRYQLSQSSTFLTWQRVVVAATVVDYFAQTYSRDQLPRLVAGFHAEDNWESLIPAVTGVSAAEFEAGWQRFLAEEYGYRGHD